MRLLNTVTKKLEEFQDEYVPRYAILSHTWRDEEVTFQDLGAGTGPGKAGYAKIEHCCRQANTDNLQYVWIDTCCIDKSSSSELSEAVNSMYRWYKEAQRCYVFLDDYPNLGSSHEQATDGCSHNSTKLEDNVPTSTFTLCNKCFRQCRWFTRGWTLQELLAPNSLKFYDRTWRQIGYIGSNNLALKTSQIRHLGEDIHDITNIPTKYISHYEEPPSASIAQRFSWVSKRQTSKAEDLAYCLLGLFDVSLPIVYGEGLKKAFIRLQEEIMKVNDDQSMFAWNLRYLPNGAGLVWDHSQSFRELRFAPQSTYQGNPYPGPLLAASPAHFENSWNIIPCKRSTINAGDPHSMTNRGLRIDIHFIKNEVFLLQPNQYSWVSSRDSSYVLLGCVAEDSPFCPLAMCVMGMAQNIYARALYVTAAAAVIGRPMYVDKPLRSVFLLQQPQRYTTSNARNHLDGTTYIFREWPDEFGRAPTAYPPECWDGMKGTIVVSAWPQKVVLEFMLRSNFDQRIALYLSHSFPHLWCGLVQVQSSVIALPSSNLYDIGVCLVRNGPEVQITPGNRSYYVRITEDLVLGGVYALKVSM